MSIVIYDQDNAEMATYTDIDIDSTYFNPNGTDTNETKLYLLGFGNYKRPILTLITFVVYFKRIGYVPMGPTVTFSVVINYQRRRRLRSAEEGIVKTTCNKISETVDRINYNCSAPVDQNKTIENVESLGDYQGDGVELEIEETSTSINVNIANQTGTELNNEYIDLYDGVYTLDKKNKRFTIVGTVNKTFNEKEITLVVDEDENGEKKEIPCTVSNIGINYTLTCELNEKIINASLIMENEYLEGVCKIFQENINIRRYPGEQCNFDVDCILPNSTCNNGKCSGGGLNDDCNETFQCLVGLYCNKELGQCKEQKGEGQTCVEGWDCQNYLGCFKGRCIKFGLLKKGIKVSWDLAPFPGEDKRNYLCYTGELEQSDGLHGNFCVENDYDDNWVKSKGKNIDEDGFIECNFGEKCYYINGKNKFDRDCQCGYNKMGQGFCPLPSARNREAWVERMKFIGNSAKNGWGRGYRCWHCLLRWMS